MFKSQGIFKGNQQDNTNIFPVDIIVDKQLSNDEIIKTCAQILSLPPDTIAVVEDLSDSIDITEEKIQLVCEQTLVGGDFKMLISIYPQNSVIEKQATNIENELAVAQKFCDISRCNCLIKNNFSIEDYEEDAYFLVRAKMEPQLVYIDLDKLDDDLYVLQK
jgi:hypothetical protein